MVPSFSEWFPEFRVRWASCRTKCLFHCPPCLSVSVSKVPVTGAWWSLSPKRPFQHETSQARAVPRASGSPESNDRQQGTLSFAFICKSSVQIYQAKSQHITPVVRNDSKVKDQEASDRKMTLSREKDESQKLLINY